MPDDSEKLLRDIYNTFDPFQPLPAGDPTYVDCSSVRGEEDILKSLGRRILWADGTTCQLYSGHRGNGKSTELLKLKEYLENKKYRVVYFAADEQDIDPEDAQYTDVLLACTRHLLRELKGSDNNPIWKWMHSRMKELGDFLKQEISLEVGASIEAQLTEFAKITATLKASPAAREKIRLLIEPHTVSLIEALNEFIASASAKMLDPGKLVVIADNLDRIVQVPSGGEHSNHDQIFIDRSEQLKKLNCHVVYTVPISLVYSRRGSTLEDCFGSVQVLPMIMLQRREETIDLAGLDKAKSLIEKRIKRVDPELELAKIFENTEALEQLCLMSGGHMRSLVLLMKTAMERAGSLPITARAVRRAMTELRITYQSSISEGEWELLAHTHRFKQIQNDDRYRDLLFRRCILEYRYYDDQDNCDLWHDIHPLIRGISNFQNALQREA